jgi:hypothetical protein
MRSAGRLRDHALGGSHRRSAMITERNIRKPGGFNAVAFGDRLPGQEASRRSGADAAITDGCDRAPAQRHRPGATGLAPPAWRHRPGATGLAAALRRERSAIMHNTVPHRGIFMIAERNVRNADGFAPRS